MIDHQDTLSTSRRGARGGGLFLLLGMFLCCLLAFAGKPRRAHTTERVKLHHADTLYYDQMVNPMARILVGNVNIEHGGTRLTCDSALVYELTNSFDAYGHVKMRQADTLLLDCDILLYDGQRELAQARRNVVLVHKKRHGNTSTLLTDTLDYDKLNDVGYYEQGGRLLDGRNELESDWGMYDLLTHDATFYYNVVLRSPAKHPRTVLKTDTLYYNTETGRARLVSLSNIFHEGKDSIFTRRGFYDTKTEQAYLLGRSVVVSGQRRIVGDSIDYNGRTRLAKAYGNVRSSDNRGVAYMDCDSVIYNDHTKLTEGFGGVTYHNKEQQRTITCDRSTNNDLTHITEGFDNVVMTDERNQREMDCDYVWQNDLTKETMATGRIDYIDHLQQRRLLCDTVFQNDLTKVMRCVGHVVYNDDLNRREIVCDSFVTNDLTKESRAKYNVYMRDFRDRRSLQCDSVYKNDSTLVTLAEGHVEYTDTLNRNKFTGGYAYYNDSTGYGKAYREALVMDFSQADTLYAHADTFFVYTHNIRTDSVTRDLHAYHHVKTFRRDMQSLCDSLVYIGRDSCATMYIDPIVWQQNQQLLGEKIHIWLNDSTIDSTYVVGQALSLEEMDTVYYNQLTSREIHSYFKNKKIDRTVAIGNVITKYYPLDDDSLKIGQNHLETTELRLFMQDGRIHHMWAAASTGTLYPIPLIPPEQMRLENFQWFARLRPTDPQDVFNWRTKDESERLKETPKREMPKMKIPE